MLEFLFIDNTEDHLMISLDWNVDSYIIFFGVDCLINEVIQQILPFQHIEFYLEIVYIFSSTCVEHGLAGWLCDKGILSTGLGKSDMGKIRI